MGNPVNLPQVATISVTVNTSGQLTGIGTNLFLVNSGLIQAAGFINNTQTGTFGGGSTPTGNLTGAFYPLNSNPSSYITTGQTGAFAGSVNTGQLTGAFYPLNSNPNSYVLGSQTGNFITTGQTGSFASAANTGQLTGVFYSKSNPSGFITSGQTGSFITSGQTGNFVTSGQTGNFILSSQTGNFVSTGQTGNFLNSFTGNFYPLVANPLAYKRDSDYNVVNTQIENFYWAAKHRQNYEDFQSFNEDWSTSGTLWTKSPALLISGGQVYGGDGGDSNNALARPFIVRTGDNARMIAYITIPPVTNRAGRTFQTVGFSSDAPGTISAGGNNSVGVGIEFADAVTGYGGTVWNGGVNDTGNLIPGTTYILQATIDNNYFTFMLMDTGHTYEYQTRVPRSQIGNVNNVYIWNSDTGRISGVSVGRIGARVSSETIYPRTGLEDYQDFIINTTDDFGQNIRVEIPKNYDSRVPAPLVLYCHGTDAGAEQVIHTYVSEPSYLQAFKNAGYIVAASANHGSADMGSNNSINDTVNIINWVRQRYAISSIFLMGVSAGGMVAMNAIASRKFKCDGFIGLFPLVNMYEHTWVLTGSEFDERTFVSGAYGITGGLPDYLIKTSGHDPVNSMSPEKMFGVPMRIYHSPQDNVVLKVQNCDLLAKLISGYQSEFTIISTSGGHGDPSNYLTGDALTFLRRCSYLPSPNSGFSLLLSPYPTPNGYVFHSETGSYTGLFYSKNNPSGFITGLSTGSFITTGQTGSFITSGSSPTITQLLGTQINLNNTISINWSSGSDFFQNNITGNTTFIFTGCQNTMSIEVLISNTTGIYTVSWPSGTTGVPPGITGVIWQGHVQPTLTTGNSLTGKSDLFSFKQINNTIYGMAAPNFY